MGNTASATGATGSRFLAGCPPIPPPPSDDEVQAQFDDLLRTKLVAATFAQEMNAIESIESKWMYVFLSGVFLTPEFADKELLEPHTCIDELAATTPAHDASLHDLSRAMRINTVLRTKYWVDKLIDADGVTSLIALLAPSRSLGAADHEEVVNALIALAISSHGVDAMAQSADIFQRIVHVYTCYTTTSRVRQRILKLLGAVSGRRSDTTTPNLGWLTKSFRDSSDEAILRLEIVTFINTLLSATVVISDRIRIREDLEKDGLSSLLQTLHEDGQSQSRVMKEQLEMYFTSATEDKAKMALSPPPPVQRRLSLSIPTVADEETKPAAVVSPDGQASTGSTANTQSTPQREGPRSLQSRKSLMLDIPVLHTETEEVPAIVSPPPAPEPVQRRLSGTLPSLSIPKLDVQFTGPKFASPKSVVVATLPEPTRAPPAELIPQAAPQDAKPSLESIVSMLQQGSKQLDPQTNEKLLQLLASLATSLSSTDGAVVVDKFERSLRSEAATPEQPAAAAESTQGVLPRISLKLSSRYSESDVSSFSRFYGNGGYESGASTPVRHTAPRSPVAFTDSRGAAPRSPAHSHYDEEHSPRRSMTETESYDESSHEHELAARSKTTSGAKLALAGFFQHLKKGQGLPTTPAPTPMATASVKKDARRPVFPSFGNMSAAPSPLPVHGGGQHHHFGSSALPPLTPLKPSLSLPPLTPVRPAHGITNTSHSQSIPIAMMKSPRLHEDRHHLEAVREEDSESPSPAQMGPDIAKFRKLLAMGAPVATVKAKMQQAGVDPLLLDTPATPAQSMSAPVPAAVTETPSSSGPDISKFRKLLAMGAPMAAVKAKMQQAGIDPALLDKPDQQPVTASPVKPDESPETPQPSSTLAAPMKIKDSPEYAKFFKLRSMGAPAEAVKAKMRQAGVNPDFLDTPNADLPATKQLDCAVPSVPAPPAPVKVKDDAEYAKFFKLQSMGAPAAAVKAKMQQAGLNPDLLDTPDAWLPPKPAVNSKNNAEHSPPTEAKKVLVKDDPAYAKFFKLKTMAPVEVVKMKMKQAGLNPDLLDTPDAELPSKSDSVDPADNGDGVSPPGAPAKILSAGAALAGMFAKRQNPSECGGKQATSTPATVVLVKDDPAYAKFFKLVAMGAPPDTVKGKMTMAGLRPELLDTPGAPLPSSSLSDSGNQASNSSTNASAGLSASPSTATGAAAPKRGNLSIKLPSSLPKPTIRPFYWQQMKGDAIKGTIWEELESESTKSNNEVPLLLADVELASLEAEFPAQTAPMTGPSKSRSLSMDTLPKELLSPRVVFLIDRSRANNISIIIKQFRMSHAALREAVMKVDTNVLTLERVQGLIKILPTDEEVAAIMGFKGDVLSLNDAERVLKELISVPRLKQRLTAMQSKLQFPSLVRDLQEKVAKLKTASTEIGQSIDFKTMLLLVLQVGNRMNAGTARGGAKGFQLADLPKLAQLKSADKTTTLLHYVARLMRQKKGNAVRLSDALTSLYDVQNIPIPELPADMSKISEVVEYITTEVGAHELKNAIEEKEACDHFVKAMKEFLGSATTTTASLKNELDHVIAKLKETMQRFGFHGENENPEDASASSTHTALTSACEFFTTIYEFCVALTKADRENEVKRLREEARAKQLLKPKTPALGPRSFSSRDMLTGRKASTNGATTAAASSGDGAKKNEDGSASSTGPETSEPRVSPMLRQRSASLSSILENNAVASALIPSSAVSKNSSESKEKDKTPGKKQGESPAGPKASCIRPPTALPKLNSNGNDKAKTGAVPGRIVKTTATPSKDKDTSPEKDFSSSVSYESPLGLTMPTGLEQPKSVKPKAQPELDDAAPFDLASIEEIRNELAKKHTTSNNNHCDVR